MNNATPVQKMNFSVLLDAMRDGLRRATIADPAAVKELALDLAEVAFLEHGRKEGDPPRAKSATRRAASTMVGLRRRFNANAYGGGDGPADADIDPKTVVDENGEHLINEAGIWTLMLQRFEEVERFETYPALNDFRRWLYQWREQVLTNREGR